jgi:hypothetical protein
MKCSVIDLVMCEGCGVDFCLHQTHVCGSVTERQKALDLAMAEHDLLRLAVCMDTLYHALGDNAERFTCEEAEAIAELFAIVGQDGHADYFMMMHADGDDEGDRHKVTKRDEFENPTEWAEVEDLGGDE